LQASTDAWASTITHQAKLVWCTHITQRATVRHRQQACDDHLIIRAC
jgi:hypothetical protein